METWSRLSPWAKAGILLGAATAGVGFFIASYLSEEKRIQGNSGDFRQVLKGVDFSKVKPYEPPSPLTLLARPPSFSSGFVPVLILYGSEYGFTYSLAQDLRKQLEELADELKSEPLLQGVGLYPRALNMEDYEKLDWSKEHLVLCLTSTYGEGVPPTTARPFFVNSLGCEFFGEDVNYTDKKLDLSHVQFSVLALGDKTYGSHFTKCGRVLDQRLEALGAKRFLNRVNIDMQDWPPIKKWFQDTKDFVKETFLKNFSKLKVTEDDDYLWKSMSAASPSARWGRRNPFYAVCVEKRPLTKVSKEDDKETIHLEFDLANSEMSYTVGDSLAVLAPAPQSNIDLFIQTLQLNPSSLIDRPAWAWNLPQEQESGKVLSQLPLRDALKFYDLKNCNPRLLQEFLSLSSSQVDSNQLSQLKSLLELGVGKENTLLTQYLSDRDSIDIFQDFSSFARLLSIQQILATLSQLTPRYYSISSSQIVEKSRVSVTVAVVRYELRGRKRKGVCSTHLADLVEKGSIIPIYVNNNPDFRIPLDASVDVIMVGPGTGFAPFRGMIAQRAFEKAPGRNLLFFGCRNHDDYLYQEEMENWAKNGHLTFFVAFSRLSKEKVYVQHLLKQQKELIFSIMQKGGHFYICGDGAHMEHDVKNEMLNIFQEMGGMSKENAEDYWKSLEKARRIQKDTWL